MDGYTKACQIFEILTAFEESSAECMTEMLVHFSNQQYANGVIQASKFIAHIDVLFAAIDSIETALIKHNDSLRLVHTKEPKQLAKKIVRFFSLLTHTRESLHTPRGEITKDLISLVTGLAHTHKVLIRIALNGALMLEKKHNVASATEELLDRFLSLGTTTSALPTRTQISDIKTDLCPVCRKSVEDVCIKYALNTLRWHAACFKCKLCGKNLAEKLPEAVCNGITVLCKGCQPKCDDFVEGTVSAATGFTISQSFERVTQLEQYVFLLRCALKRLCGLLNVRFEDWPQGNDMLVSQRIRNLILTSTGHSPAAEASRSGSLPLGPTGVEASSSVDGVRTRPFSTLIPIQPAAIQLSASTFSDSRTWHPSIAPYSDDFHPETSPNWEALNVEQGALSTGRRIHSRYATANIGMARTGRETDRNSLRSQKSLRNRAKSFSGSLISRRLSGRSGGELAKKPESLAETAVESQKPLSSAERLTAEPSNEESEEEDDDLEDEGAAMVSPLNFASDSSHNEKTSARYSVGVGSLEDELSLAALSLDAGRVSSQPDEAEMSNPPLPLEPSPAQQALKKKLMQESAESQRNANKKIADIPDAPSSLTGHVRFLSELSALESFMIRQYAVVDLHPLISDYFSLNELMELVEIRKLTIWEKMVSSLKGSSKRTSRQKNEGTFGVPLEQLVEKYGVATDLAYSPGQLRIPLAIDVCMQALYRSDLESEGVFRKNGNIRRLKQMAGIMDLDPTLRTVQWNVTKHNAVQLAALLKKFLRDLPEPLLTFKLHEMFCVSQKLDTPEQQTECLHLLICLLPKPNRDLLEVILFLLRRVAKLSESNRMDLDNLATVVAPNILYSKSKNPVDDQGPLAIAAVRALLEHAEQFCLVPSALWERMRHQNNFSEPLQSLPSTFKILSGDANFAKAIRHSEPAISVEAAEAIKAAKPPLVVGEAGGSFPPDHAKLSVAPIHPYLQHHSQPNSPFAATTPLPSKSPAAVQAQNGTASHPVAVQGLVSQLDNYSSDGSKASDHNFNTI